MPKGKGILLVKNDATLHYYCNSKCERNTALGRDPRYVRWTQTYRKQKKSKSSE